MIEATHIVQPPVTPSGNLTDQAGDLEQPNICVTTDQPSLELNTLSQNVYQPNSLPTHNFVPILEEQADTQLIIKATHTIQPPITPNHSTLCRELEQPNSMNVMDKLSSSLSVDQSSIPQHPLDVLQDIGQPTMSTHHPEELAPSSQYVDTSGHPVVELTYQAKIYWMKVYHNH